jgi:hypothetical protein
VNALRVLVTEDEPNAAVCATDELRAAGHEVVRCVGPHDQAFPCVGLRDIAECPLRNGVVDVTLAVRHMPSSAPSRREDGVLCSIRHHVPVVVAGNTLFDPFESWEGDAVGEHEDIVDACVRAASEPLPRHSEIARHAAWEVVRLHSRDISVLEAVHRMEAVEASVRRVGGRLLVEIVAEVDPAIEPMVAVRVTVALRAFDKDARAIDVSVVRPHTAADHVARR